MSAAEKKKSTSEKLRVLDAQWRKELLGEDAVMDALPQIVAVIEAAERFEDDDETAMAWANIKRDIRVALAALDEKLNGAEASPTPERT